MTMYPSTAVAYCLLIAALTVGSEGSDSACLAYPGASCQDTKTYTCPGYWFTGLCDGPTTRKCCAPDTGCDAQGGDCIQPNLASSCNGYYESGLCHGPSDRQCCIDGSDSACLAYPGASCQDTQTYSCPGYWFSGLCDGPTTRKCCAPDTECDARGGDCIQPDLASSCNGYYESGLCHGPSDRRCCIGTGTCTISEYTGSNMEHLYSYKKIYVENGFRAHMDTINSYASTCNVIVVTTSTWRNYIPSGGATNSNHLVGHAIDFNLKPTSGSGWCNSACLITRTSMPLSSPYRCFLDKVVANPSLRWGGLFSTADPVHIDDHYNSDTSAGSPYQLLKTQVQSSCGYITDN